MDLMAYVPNFGEPINLDRGPCIVHNCEVPKEKDPLDNFIRGKSFASKLRRWLRRQCILSRKHPLTRWCLKSKAAVNYEIDRQLRSHPYMIHPFSSFRTFWESIMAVFTFVALLIIPVLLTFYLNEHESWHTTANVIDAVFMCDMVVWFFTGYYDYSTKSIVLDPIIVARKYLRGYFVVDLMSVLPLEFLEHILSQPVWYCSLVSMLKLLRMKTVIVYGRRLRYVYKIHFQSYKMLEMSAIIIICIHWAACLEYYVPDLVSKIAGVNEESWIQARYVKKRDTILKKYLTCLNRATTALVCSAHYLKMSAPEDIMLNLILTIIGILGLIYLLGQICQLMTTFHSTNKRHLKLIQQLREYMKHKELPHTLQRRLLAFYNYRNKKGFERDRLIINQVSPYLREFLVVCRNRYLSVQELLLHNYMRFVNSVELFKYLPKTVMGRIATCLRSEIFMTGDVIVKVGTLGDALYFICSGTVAVFTATGKEVCHLEDGAYFGEIALVMDSEHRIATIVAVETCEIYILRRANFQRVMNLYPDLLDRMRSAALEHLERSTLLTDNSKYDSTTPPRYINISSIKGLRGD